MITDGGFLGWLVAPLLQTFSRVTGNMDMPEKSKLDFLKVIGGYHMRILEGSDTLVQLSGLVAKLCLLKLTVAPSA